MISRCLCDFSGSAPGRFWIGVGVFAITCGVWNNPSHAVNLWYDFEGDTGSVATDKLDSDGTQDGDLTGNISFISGSSVPFGSQAALFEPPTLFNPPFATLEVPGSTVLSDSFTLAMHADVENTGAFRLFSSYAGSGPVGADDILFDFQPTLGLRAFVGGTSVTETVVPEFPSAGYHHYALTVDNGLATLYFDGAEVGSGLVPAGTNAFNLNIGEDLGGTPNEQLRGNVDDVVVLDEALAPAVIAQLASGVSVQTAVTPTGSYAVNYNFENGFDDAFVADGNQAAIPSFAIGTPIDSDSANAKEGQASVHFNDMSTLLPRFSQIVTPVTGTDLGDQFTLSAVVNVSQGGFAADGIIRLFSTYAGGGSAANALILDFNPDADVSGIGIRLILPGRGSTTFPGTFSFDEDHTITAVYDNGEVRLYLNGVEVQTNSVASGEVDLGDVLLRIGEDRGGAVNGNFDGTMDDVLILDRALTARQVRFMAREGFAALLAVPEPTSSVLLIGICSIAIAVIFRRRTLNSIS